MVEAASVKACSNENVARIVEPQYLTTPLGELVTAVEPPNDVR